MDREKLEKLEKLEKEKRTGSRRGSPAARASGLAASSAPRLSGARTCPFVEKGPARLRRRSDDDPLLRLRGLQVRMASSTL